MMSDRDIDSLEDDLDSLEQEEEAGDWRKYLRFAPMALAAGAFVIFSVIVLIAYSGGDEEDEEPVQVAAPVLTPETAIKIEPDQPGGMEIPDQDKLVYNQLNQGTDDGQVEQILPGPETPKSPPTVDAEPGKPPVPAGTVPPPTEPDVALLAEPQTPAPAAVPAPPGGQTATGKPAESGSAAAATVPAPSANPGLPQTPDGVVPPAETPILNGPETVPDGDAVAEVPRTAATSQMRTLAGVYRIQVASLRSPAQAEREWSDQVKKNPDLLSKLSLTVQRAVIKNGGTYYRVQAGPIQDRESADRLCRDLRSRGQDCIVVRP